MIYKLYLMTANGYKKMGETNYETIMYVLDELIEEDPNRQIIVIERDEETQSDNVFYCHTGSIEQYIDWKNSLNKCIKKLRKE